MRVIVIAGLLVAGCGQSGEAPPNNSQASGSPASEGWRLEMGSDGPSLILAGDGTPQIRLICRSGAQQLLVNVPSFDPIGSEERLSFGQGGEVIALVADVRGDPTLGGVTGEGQVPQNLPDLLSGRVSASYGAQTSGPHPTPPPALANGFADACSSGSPNGSGSPGPADSADPEQSASGDRSACLRSRDGGEPIPANAIKAVGTEPFWAASVEGRCVTYSHPENQSGTRVWTSFSGTASSGTWTGSLNGQPFVMKTTPQPGCSDGMSDKRYPIAVSLTVGGEQRTGCAEPR